MAPLASIKRPVEGVAHLFRELFAISHTIKSPTGKQVLTICSKVSDGAALLLLNTTSIISFFQMNQNIPSVFVIVTIGRNLGRFVIRST